jgi:hypothetical protein
MWPCALAAANQSYVYFACSEGCRMSYHHPVCYHRLVDALRQQATSFKGFKVRNSLWNTALNCIQSS